jgi:hemerythrin-like metal-binding protein
MASVAWSEMMSVGVPVLDADHKTLVGLMNDLHRSIGDEEEYATLGSVLQALDEYAAHHFAREERVMAACRYPSAQTHARMHHRLTQQVRELKERYDSDQTTVRAKDCLDFLHKWLLEHICSTDMDYRAWVVGHPEAEQAASALNLAESRPGKTGLDWKTLRVLVVDDNQNFIQVMRTILEGVGVNDIRTCSDLDGAKAILTGTEVDIVISDWHVGAESGLDLVGWIRRQDELSTLPVLVLSGHERVASRDVALSAGADEFMEKPISARGLLLCLSRLAQASRGRDE